MDSFGRPRKFATSRKQELQLQSELKVIRKKALCDQYMKQQSDYGKKIPKPPLEEFASSVESRRALRQIDDKRKGMTRGRPLCEPLVSKLETRNRTKSSKNTTNQAEKKTSPQKIVLDTSQAVKFAITRSLNTSVPIQQTQPANTRMLVPKAKPSSTSQGQASLMSVPSESSNQKCTVESHTENADVNSSHTSNPLLASSKPLAFTAESEEMFSLSREVKEDIIDDQSCHHSSTEASMSVGSQDYLDSTTSEVLPEALSPRTEGTSPHIQHAPSGTLMLEVDMRFRSDSKDGHISELSENVQSGDRFSPLPKMPTVDDSDGWSVLSQDDAKSRSIESATALHEETSATSLPSDFDQKDYLLGSQYSSPAPSSPAVHNPTSPDPSENAAHISTLPLSNSGSLLKSDSSPHGRSTSTIKASEGKESLFFSVHGSLSSFGRPFSSASHSLSVTSSRELSLLTDGNAHPQFEDTVTCRLSDSPCPQLPQIASNQKLTTSSWLQIIDKNGYDSEHSSTTIVEDEHTCTSEMNLTAIESQSPPQTSEMCSSEHTESAVGCYPPETTVDSISDHQVLGAEFEDQTTVSNRDSADSETTSVVENCDDDHVHELLAFSDKPVTLEDVLSITGEKLPEHPRMYMYSPSKASESKQSKLTLLSTWDSSVTYPTSTSTSIHHFCAQNQLPQLPLFLQMLSKQTHARAGKSEQGSSDKKVDLVPPSLHASEPSVQVKTNEGGQKVRLRVKPSALCKTSHTYGTPSASSYESKGVQSSFDIDGFITYAHIRLQKELNSSLHTSSEKSVLDSTLKLPAKDKIPQIQETGDLVLTGEGMQIVKDPSNLLWTPAPPKLSLHPSTIQSHLFPQYKTGPADKSTDAATEQTYSFITDHTEYSKVSVVSVDKHKKKDTVERTRLLDPQFKSVPRFTLLQTELTTQPNQQEISNSDHSKDMPADIVPEVDENPSQITTQELPSVDSSRHQSISGHPSKSTEGASQLHCTQSLPQLTPATDHVSLTAGNDFNSLMREIQLQRDRLIEHHKELKAPHLVSIVSTDELRPLEETQMFDESFCASSGAFTSRKLQRQFMKGTKRGTSKGGATGRTRAIRRTKSAQLRTGKARELLSQPPRMLKRRGSFPLFHKELCKITEHQQAQISYKSPSGRDSVPDLTDQRFESLMLSQGAVPGRDDPSKWAYSIWWDTWFPEVLKECREALAELYSGHRARVEPQKTKPESKMKQSETTSQESTPKEQQEDWSNKVLELGDIGPLLTNHSSSDSYVDELSALNETIDQCKATEMVAVYLCRRGALLRKLGKLTESLADLNRALHLQPILSDAYWHRHLLFLVQGDQKRALEDLSLLLKQNKKHFGAFRSRAALQLQKGDLSSAVYSMSQAIALQPNDPNSYFVRAEIYEKRGEIESALSDYAHVSELDPTNIEALSRPATHKYNKGMWAASTQHFGTLLLRDPNNTEARIHRAKAHYNLGQYVEALQDLSAAIHLEPNGAQAFYHRACLLRNSQPKQALKDFSISLLLDESAANVHAFIHRGILYIQLNCYDEALSDFESAVRLKRTLPSPHVCAGLVHMLHRNNITRAIRCFSTAIFVDPTCIRAYLCRANAFQRDAKFKLAILDYTRAIHLEPNNPTYYLYKGELYLTMGELELASLHISIAAKLSTGFDQNKAQRALVDSFLGNHQQAITLLRRLPKTPEIYCLLGRIQLKAKDFSASADSLKQAIHLADRAVKPSHLVTHVDSRGNIDKTGPKETVNKKIKTGFHYFCGKSLVENSALKEAINEFSKVIDSFPSLALAYYERGVAKLMDNNPKGMLDLNKSLALNPKLFQTYLARASYYGKTGRYSKAILNCNEAIKLEPASVRAYVCRGALKYQGKMYDGAIEDYSTAIRLDPQRASLAHFNRALCYQALGKLQKALSDYSVVLLLDNSPKLKVHINRALLYLERGDWANSLLDFVMAGKIKKDDPGIFQAIALCYHSLRSLDSAIEAYTTAIELDPTFLGAFIGRGNAYMDYLTEEGNAKSRQDYLHALDLDPTYLSARVNLAFLLQAEGKFQEAWNELTVVLQADQWYVPAREARAVISLQIGNQFGALLDINAAIQVCKTALLLTNRGVIHQFMGDVVSAMSDYHKAVQIDAGYSLAHFNIGNILFTQRHFKQAVDSYTKALGDKNNEDSVYLNRAIAHVMLGETESAFDDFREAIQANPYSAHAYFNRGNLYRSLGELPKAEKDYKQALDLQPDDWLTMFYYGEALSQLKRESSAHDLLTMAVQIQPL